MYDVMVREASVIHSELKYSLLVLLYLLYLLSIRCVTEDLVFATSLAREKGGNLKLQRHSVEVLHVLLK